MSNNQTSEFFGGLLLLAVMVVLPIYLWTGNGDDKNKYPWLPAATDKDGQANWLMGEMPSPVEFKTYDDCMERVQQFLGSKNNYQGYKQPAACGYSSNSYIDMYITNTLHESSLFSCIAKEIRSPDTEGVPTYSAAIIRHGQPRPGGTVVLFALNSGSKFMSLK